MDIETLWRPDDGPEAEDGIGGPAAQLDHQQQPADLGHGRLVVGPLGRLRHLDLLESLQEHDQPDIIIIF